MISLFGTRAGNVSGALDFDCQMGSKNKLRMEREVYVRTSGLLWTIFCNF